MHLSVKYLLYPWQITNFPPKEQIFLKICHLSEKGTMMDPNEI